MIFNIICRIYFFDNNHVISGFDVRGNIIYSAMFFMLGGILFLYKNSIYEFGQKKKILITLLIVIIAGIYFYQGKSEPFIMLVLFGLLLIYSIASQNNTGKILPNKFTKFIWKHQFRNLFVPYGFLSNDRKSTYESLIWK